MPQENPDPKAKEPVKIPTEQKVDPIIHVKPKDEQLKRPEPKLPKIPSYDRHVAAQNQYSNQPVIKGNVSVEQIIKMEEDYLKRNLTVQERKMVADRVQYLQKHQGFTVNRT